MQTSTGIRERIDHIYQSLRPAERAVAQYVRDHPDDTAGLTVGTLAVLCHVSEPTVIRFSRKLGFSGYRELRYALQHPQTKRQTTFDPLAECDLNPWNTPEDVPDKVVGNATLLLNNLLNSLNRKDFHTAVEFIAHARLVDIIGAGCSLAPATDLCVKLNYLGLLCRLNSQSSIQRIATANLTDNDVVVAFSYSGGSADTVEALRLAQSRGARTIAVTATAGSPILAWADTALLVGTTTTTIDGHSAMYSHMAYTAVVDMLYMGVILSDYGRFSTELDRSQQ